jgi:RNA polymerase sigma-70 factor (ECF subfamily)
MTDENRIDQDDRELIRRIAAKEPEALEAFYTRYNRLAFTLIFRIVSNREDAEDVLVDVFWQVWGQASRYDAARGKPVAWLLTIARTRAIDCLRASDRRALAAEVQEAAQAHGSRSGNSDPFVVEGTRQAVQAALLELPEQQRVPLEMSYFQGMSHGEIAKALGQPLGTVKDRVRNGMLHLKKQLKAYL